MWHAYLLPATDLMWATSRSRRVPGCRRRGISPIRTCRRGVCLPGPVISSIIRLLREREIYRIILIISLLRWIPPLYWVCFPSIPLHRTPLLRNLRPRHTRPQARRRTGLWRILIPSIWRSPNNHRIRRRTRGWNPLPQTPSMLRSTSKYRRGSLWNHLEHFWFRLD